MSVECTVSNAPVQPSADGTDVSLAVIGRDTSSVRPECPLCGSPGALLYRALSDQLFGARGEWNYRRCQGRNCGLVWIESLPNAVQLAQAYAHYYTHQPAEKDQQRGNRFREYVQVAYLATRYGYHANGRKWLSALVSLLAWGWPRCRAEVDGRVRLLRAEPGGSLLDLGCGAGDWLMEMRGRGWRVVGVEFDEAAASLARRRGLDVRSGSLESQHLPEQGFDAITLNHVIEHLADPVSTLRECRRLLKPNGRLIIFTPNADSLGHQVWRQYWRGLEPPRHLHVFGFASMRFALRAAGFPSTNLLPWVADSMLRESWLLQRGWTGPFTGHRWPLALRLKVRLASMVERLVMAFSPRTADCLVSVSVRRDEATSEVVVKSKTLMGFL